MGTMLRKHNLSLSLLVLAIDVGTIAGAFVLSHWIRYDWPSFYTIDLFPYKDIMSNGIGDLSPHSWLLIAIIPLWEGMIVWAKVFLPSRTAGYFDVIWTVAACVFLATGAFGAVAFALQLEFLSRGVILIFVAVSTVLLSVEKCGLIFVLRFLRRKRRNLNFMLVVGTGPRACKFLQDIDDHPEWGIQVVGLIDKDAEMVGKSVRGHSVLGRLEDIPYILSTQVVDTVTYIVPHKWIGDLGASIYRCELQGVDVQVALDLFQYDIGRVRISNHGRLPMLSLEATSIPVWKAVVKRSLDIAVSALALFLISPLLLLISIVIKLTSPGPVFYTQKRNGLRGREFRMLKFRSMVVNAEELLAGLSEKNDMSGAAFKCKDDPRVTPVGQFLRRYSLDELPQLVNVLLGHMSLVGPRPLIASERDKYEEWQQRRMSVRPGITCLWQINGRNELDFENWMKLDLNYIDQWSILNDLKILAKTLPAVLRGKGAY